MRSLLILGSVCDLGLSYLWSNEQLLHTLLFNNAMLGVAAELLRARTSLSARCKVDRE